MDDPPSAHPPSDSAGRTGQLIVTTLIVTMPLVTTPLVTAGAHRGL